MGRTSQSATFRLAIESKTLCVCVCVCVRYTTKELQHQSSVACICYVRARVSGRVYLGWINVVQHHDGCAVIVQDQPPEILHRVRKWVLGHDECRWLLVALRGREIGKEEMVIEHFKSK